MEVVSLICFASARGQLPPVLLRCFDDEHEQLQFPFINLREMHLLRCSWPVRSIGIRTSRLRVDGGRYRSTGEVIIYSVIHVSNIIHHSKLTHLRPTRSDTKTRSTHPYLVRNLRSSSICVSDTKSSRSSHTSTSDY
jgi:hypothetical protein